LRLDLIGGQLFEDTGETISGVVYDDIEAAEFLDGVLECRIDLGLVGDIELESEVVLLLVSHGFPEMEIKRTCLIVCVLET